MRSPGDYDVSKEEIAYVRGLLASYSLPHLYGIPHHTEVRMPILINNDKTLTLNFNSPPAAIISIDQIDNAPRSRPEILKVRIENEEGLGAFFWITASVSKQGRPVIEVSTANGDGFTRRSVTGTCNRL